MPTENRSSNTEMVSALKKAFTTAESGNGEYRIVMKFQSLADMQDCHQKLALALSCSTEQRHGEASEWVSPVQLSQVNAQYDQGFADGCSESKRLNHNTDGEQQ
ncbi:hypothetical protein [Pseudomonas sp. Marseille-P9655]|uniref:hypothetical protein n=1 Tax=Pseudomonas sp. Marseille-P9655 TaxID=2866591 RepID=UPI001CE44C9F|nr:hypothetical protein [Pseudomonas sp. Marseille-P9655]